MGRLRSQEIAKGAPMLLHTHLCTTQAYTMCNVIFRQSVRLRLRLVPLSLQGGGARGGGSGPSDIIPGETSITRYQPDCVGKDARAKLVAVWPIPCY